MFRRRARRGNGDADKKKGNDYKALAAIVKSDKLPTEMALTTPRNFSTCSDATVHMMKKVPVITKKVGTFYIRIGAVGKNTTKVTAHDESVIKLSGRQKPVSLNRMLYVPYVEHGLISVSRICNDN